MPVSSLYSIAPHAPFLPTLVKRIMDGTLPGRSRAPADFGLADLTIFVPTARARAALAKAFLEQSDGALLLPDIRTLGEQSEEEVLFLPPFEAPAMPPAINLLSRRLLLAKLVQTWVNAQKSNTSYVVSSGPVEILTLADSLAELIDDCHIERISPSKIKTLVPEASNLSKNWQQALDFLSIILDAWPDILAQRGEVDGATQRNLRLERQARAAALIYGDNPVIAAGSTGSIPATANLLKAIAQLPNGALVLPGLDTTISRAGHADLLNEKEAPHAHAQYGLARLLDRLNTTHSAVKELADDTGDTRSQLIRRALALPKDTLLWATTRKTMPQVVLTNICEGISICVARTQELEARAIALAARHALSKGQTVAIVSSDRNLTRRVTAELARFEVTVDDSAGTPLFQSRTGRLTRQIIAACVTAFASVDLIALLRNRYVTMGRKRAEIAKLTDLLETAILRGQRPAAGSAGLLDLIDANHAGKLPHARQRLTDEEAEKLRTLICDVEVMLAPLTALLEQAHLETGALATALEEVLRAVIGASEQNAATPDGYAVFERWAAQMHTSAGHGPQFTGRDITSVVQGLMAGFTVRPAGAARDDIAILGLLEARLQSADLMILAGLNEGIWPQPADPGPWLSRNMRLAVGLEPPERQQGQMAHDFEMAMGNENLLMSFSERLGTAPALPSRLVQRLEAYLGEERTRYLREKGEYWCALAQRLDFAGLVKPAMRPMPCPHAHLRPRSLSVTEIETLMRSPYDIYAKYVLGLKPLDALGDDPDNRERGTLVHEVFAKFVETGTDPTAPDARQKLLAIADGVFLTLDTARARRAVWRRRLENQAEAYLKFEQDRFGRVARRHVERDGQWDFDVTGEKFTLRGRADRIDEMTNGMLEIIDFKTGTVPAPKDMKNFTAPQLLAEAAIATRGAFKGVAPAPVAALSYIKLAAGPDAFSLTQFTLKEGMDIAVATDALIVRLSRHVDAFLMRDNLPMTARLFPDLNQNFAGPYDHLSRMGEWTEIYGEEDD